MQSYIETSQKSARKSGREEPGSQGIAPEVMNQCQRWSAGFQNMGKRSLGHGRPALTYIDIFKEDTGLEADYFMTAMQDRNLWNAIVVRENQ